MQPARVPSTLSAPQHVKHGLVARGCIARAHGSPQRRRIGHLPEWVNRHGLS